MLEQASCWCEMHSREKGVLDVRDGGVYLASLYVLLHSCDYDTIDPPRTYLIESLNELRLTSSLGNTWGGLGTCSGENFKIDSMFLCILILMCGCWVQCGLLQVCI